MKNLSIIALLICALATGCRTRTATADYNVVPLPRGVEPLENAPSGKISSSTLIVYPAGDERLLRTAELLRDYIREGLGVELTITDTPATTNHITLGVEPGDVDSYVLSVGGDGIRITGGDHAGVFYGVQTLRKSIPAGSVGSKLSLPAATITDHPQFAYRGMHLDVARHFFPVDSVKSYIDMLALHNINRFHWHLTDDQGWRIQIDKYPRLAEVAAWRAGTLVGHYGDTPERYDGVRYGGHYTKEQMREVVEYAADRHITVIPEVELPGHALAALSAYPEFGCTGGPYEAAQGWGVFPDIFCAGNEGTMKFLEDILDEVVEIFPSKYIHIGGDEAPKERWSLCPKCQAKIRELGIKPREAHTAENQLQSYVVARMAAHLEKYGRQAIGWDEILEGGMTSDATVMSWRGVDGGIEAARLGHDAIMSPNSHMYFDYYQSEETENEPLAIGGYLPLEKVYGYDPLPETLSDGERTRIVGVQANLWTEYIPEFSHVQYMVLPRMAALSEVQWGDPAKKDYAAFTLRLNRMAALYDQLGYHHGKTLNR